MGWAGLKHRLPFLIGPWAVGVGRILAAPNILDAGRGIGCQVPALRSPAKQPRETSLHIVGEFTPLVLGRLVPDRDDLGLVEPNERGCRQSASGSRRQPDSRTWCAGRGR